MSIKQELRWEHTGIAWVAPASDAAGGSYLITGFERDAQGVRTFRAYHCAYGQRDPNKARHLPPNAASLDEAKALAQGDHDALKV